LVRVESLARRVDELAPDGDLLDSLHFSWFDRPYAKATLTTLVKTSTVLRREVRMRNAGNGAIPAARLGDMLHWAEDAVERVLVDEPDPGFRPHRIRVTPRAIVDGTTPPLFAFLDRATATRSHALFGDLDLLAALGQRAYARKTDDWPDATRFAALARRVEYLGMAVVDVAPNPIGEEGTVSATSIENVLRLQPRTLAELLSGMTTGDAHGLTAVIDPVAGESWPSRIARRALVRGATRRSRYCVCEWNPGCMDALPSTSVSPIAPAMWLDAMEGVSLTVTVHGPAGMSGGMG